MKITVINGTEKHGVTWHLKEIFLEAFREKAEITEFYLPRDCPAFCSGCCSCFFQGEHTCKDSGYISKMAAALLEADLIVMTSPAYVMHATGAMKAFLDHLGYLWLSHRPAPEMFQKRAVVITQCIGAGAKSTATDIKHSLSWWGISEISVFTEKLMSEIVWEKLTEKKRSQLTEKMKQLSQKLSLVDYGKPSSVNAITRIKFFFCRMIKKSIYKNNPEDRDGKYWASQGWLEKNRPWKSQKNNLSFWCRN